MRRPTPGRNPPVPAAAETSRLSFASERHRGGLMRVAGSHGGDAARRRPGHPGARCRGRIDPASRARRRGKSWRNFAGRQGHACATPFSDLDGVDFMSGPGQLLCTCCSSVALVRDYLPGDAAADHQRRLAIHQFLQFAVEDTRLGGDPKCQLLGWAHRHDLLRDVRSSPAQVGWRAEDGGYRRSGRGGVP